MIQIGIADTLRKKVSAMFDTKYLKINNLTERCKANGFASLCAVGDLMRLAVCVDYAQKYTLPFYKKRGIPLSVFYDTMVDISVWCENNDNKGLKNYNWLKNHLKGELFKVGRLQYQFYKCDNLTFDYKKLPVSSGDNAVFVHIPQGEKLDFNACKASLVDSKEFFKQYFPDYKFNYFICESWLLYGSNGEFMSENSNIVKFQSLFNIAYSEKDDSQGIERIFGKRRLLVSQYPEDTTLRRQAKAYIQRGGISLAVILILTNCFTALAKTVCSISKQSGLPRQHILMFRLACFQ